jgi:hypothetical protein
MRNDRARECLCKWWKNLGVAADLQDVQRDALILSATPACFTVVGLDDRQALRQNLSRRLWMGDRVRGRRAPTAEGQGQGGSRSQSKRRLTNSTRGGTIEASTGPGQVNMDDGEDLLALIFKHEPDALAEMLQELVHDGDVWKGMCTYPVGPSTSKVQAAVFLPRLQRAAVRAFIRHKSSSP